MVAESGMAQFSIPVLQTPLLLKENNGCSRSTVVYKPNSKTEMLLTKWDHAPG